MTHDPEGARLPENAMLAVSLRVEGERVVGRVAALSGEVWNVDMPLQARLDAALRPFTQEKVGEDG